MKIIKQLMCSTAILNLPTVVRRKSSVAGIIDKHGGLRIVVAYPETFCNHLQPGELIYEVPDLYVQEPLTWEEKNIIPQLATKHVDWFISTRNDPDYKKHPFIAQYLKRKAEGNPHSQHFEEDMV